MFCFWCQFITELVGARATGFQHLHPFVSSLFPFGKWEVDFFVDFEALQQCCLMLCHWTCAKWPLKLWLSFGNGNSCIWTKSIGDNIILETLHPHQLVELRLRFNWNRAFIDRLLQKRWHPVNGWVDVCLGQSLGRRTANAIFSPRPSSIISPHFMWSAIRSTKGVASVRDANRLEWQFYRTVLCASKSINATLSLLDYWHCLTTGSGSHASPTHPSAKFYWRIDTRVVTLGHTCMWLLTDF